MRRGYLRLQQLLFEIIAAYKFRIVAAASQFVNAWRFQRFAWSETACSLLGSTAAERLGQARRASQRIGFEFLRHTVAPARGNFVDRQLFASASVAPKGIGRYGHGELPQSCSKGTGSPLT